MNLKTMSSGERFQRPSPLVRISAQDIDCGRFYEYPQSLFLSRNKKDNVYHCKPQFCYIKVGIKSSQNYIGIFL